MLTDSEKRWLKLRKLYEGVNYYSYYSCMHCPEYNIGRWHGYKRPCNEACLSNGCPFIDIGSSQAVFDYIEAAEFEERVAAKLAELFATISLVGNTTEFDCESSCPAFSMCCTILHEGLPCDEAILMYARLQVEEEMDGIPV